MFSLLQFNVIAEVGNNPSRGKLEIHFFNQMERDAFIKEKAPKPPYPILVRPDQMFLRKEIEFKLIPHSDIPTMVCLRDLPLMGEGNKVTIPNDVRQLITQKMQELYPSEWNYTEPLKIVSQYPNSPESPLAYSASKLNEIKDIGDRSLGNLIDHMESPQKKAGAKMFDFKAEPFLKQNNSKKISRSYSKEEFAGKADGFLNAHHGGTNFLLFFLRRLKKFIVRPLKKPARHLFIFSSFVAIGACLVGCYLLALSMTAALLQGMLLGAVACLGLFLRHQYYDRVRRDIRQGIILMTHKQELAYSEGGEANMSWKVYINSFKDFNSWKNFSYFGAGMVGQDEEKTLKKRRYK